MQSFGKMFVQFLKKIYVLSFLLFLLIVFPSISFGSTNVCGPVFSDKTWDLAGSPYIVTCNILVYEGATLTIEAGVEVLFNETFSIQVNGLLIAQGTEEKMITFTSNKNPQEPGDWGCLEFNGSIAVDSIMEYCKVEYGGYNRKGCIIRTSDIKVAGKVFSINHCILKNCCCTQNAGQGDNHGAVSIFKTYYNITNSIISNNKGRGM